MLIVTIILDQDMLHLVECLNQHYQATSLAFCTCKYFILFWFKKKILMTYPIKIFWGDLSECVTRGFNFDLYLHCIFAYYPIKKKLANLDGNCISSLTDNSCLCLLYICNCLLLFSEVKYIRHSKDCLPFYFQFQMVLLIEAHQSF